MFPILLGKTKELEAKCADLQRQIDEGGGGGTEIFEITGGTDPDTNITTLSKTFKEIESAFKNGKLCIITFSENAFYGYAYVIDIYYNPSMDFPYGVCTVFDTFSCENETDYPYVN